MTKTFRMLVIRIQKFRIGCLNHAELLIKDLKTNIDKSERELGNLRSCLQKAISSFTRLLPTRVKSSKNAFLQLEQSAVDIKQNAVAAETNVECLIALWEMVKYEMHRVQSSVKRAIDSKRWITEEEIVDIFDDLKLQYKPLQDGLENYALAMLPC